MKPDAPAVRLGIIGFGVHARTQHLPALRSIQREEPESVQIVAVCDPVASHRALVPEAVFVDDWSALLEQALDVVFICTPRESIAAAAQAAHARGMALWIEKPLGVDLAEAAALVACGPRVAVSMNRRFDPALVHLYRALERCPPRWVEATMARVDRREPEFAVTTGIHVLDAVVAAIGEWELNTLVPRSRWGAIWHDLQGTGVTGRCDVLVRLQPTAGHACETIAVGGPEGMVTAASSACGPGFVNGVWNGADLSWQAASTTPEWERNGTLEETRAVLAAVRGHGPFTPTPAMVVTATRLAARIDT